MNAPATRAATAPDTINAAHAVLQRAAWIENGVAGQMREAA